MSRNTARKGSAGKSCLRKFFHFIPVSIMNTFQENTDNDYSTAIESETEAIKFCGEKGDKAWFDLSKWLKDRDFPTPKARSQCFNMGRSLQKGKELSVALSISCMKAWKDAEIRGWIHLEQDS